MTDAQFADRTLSEDKVLEAFGRLHAAAPPREDGQLDLRALDTSIERDPRRSGARPMTAEELNEQFGHIPSDGEG